MRPALVFLAFALLQAGAVRANAQAEAQAAAAAYVGRPVASVSLAIEDRPTAEPALVDLIQTRAGRPLSMVDVRESITHLFSLGRFEDVRVDAQATEGGVQLRYNLIPIHSVSRVEFHGDFALSDATLRSRVVERFGPAPPVGRADEVARTLEELYHDRGYMKATVRPSPVVEHNPDRTILVFDIDAGPRARIGTITIVGNPLAQRNDLLRRLAVAPDETYLRVELSKRLSEYAQQLRHRGYYQAAAAHHAKLADDGTRVDLTIEVQPGPLVTVRYDGDPLPKEKLAELVPIEREGSVDQDLLEDSAARIEQYLQQQGYWKAAARVERREENGGLTIALHISRGRQYRVAPGGVEITGNGSIPSEELRGLVKLSPGEVFVESKLDAAVSAIRNLYLSRGFANQRVSSAVTEQEPGLVKPVIVVNEGPKIVVGKITISGNQTMPTNALMAVVKKKTGDPFFGPAVATDREALREEYLNRGFHSADVSVKPVLSADGTVADLPFLVTEGPRTIVDHVLIVGNTRTDPAVIEKELLLHPGQPLGYADLVESQRRLNALGLFRRVRITEAAHGTGEARDVVVTVEEALRTTMGYGGGAEIDKRLVTGAGGEAREQYEFAPRGFFEIGRRNLGGRNRSVNLYTRLSLRPNNNPADQKAFGFSEYRVVGTYREPRALNDRGDLTVTAAVEQGVRSSFNFARKGVNAELTRRLSKTVRTSVRYSFGTTRTFDEQLSPQDQLTIDRLFPQVRLSAFSGAVYRDTRDDLLEPQHGTLASSDLELAARAIGSQVGFAKLFVQGFWYRNLGPKRLVFATGARLGAANAFARLTQPTGADGKPLPGPPVTVRDLPASERFFAGGDTTIRGFALDTVGAPNTISPQGFPKGGNALIVLNAELRFPVWRQLGAALFTDAGNVFSRPGDFDLGALRGSVGFGIRYHSPIGPIRVDLGFKLNRREVAGNLEQLTVLHFSIGQAF